jgi:seryl-tRNA(Sec) selenium transferase
VRVRVTGRSASSLERAFRQSDPAVIVRIENEALLLDPRTLAKDEYTLIRIALESILKTPAAPHP